MQSTIIFALFSTITICGKVYGHGRMLEPPNRSSVWRFPEFEYLQPEINYDDNQLFCGGAQVQHEQNGGRCGICGDSFEVPQPRPNEGGGLYGRGIIVRNYTEGQIIDIEVQLTQSHLGYFNFKICPHNNPLVPVDQECLDQYPLPLADGSGYNYPIPTFTNKMYKTQVVLPPGVTCSQCVLQWHYRTGNSVGVCPGGEWGLGCGNQETFRGCADVSIQRL